LRKDLLRARSAHRGRKKKRKQTNGHKLPGGGGGGTVYEHRNLRVRRNDRRGQKNHVGEDSKEHLKKTTMSQGGFWKKDPCLGERCGLLETN